MKYGIAVRIVETGYVEIEAECEAEAKAIAEGDAMEGLVLFHDVQVLDSAVESIIDESEEEPKNAKRKRRASCRTPRKNGTGNEAI